MITELWIFVILGVYIGAACLWYRYQDCGWYRFYFSEWQNSLEINKLSVKTPDGYKQYTLWHDKKYAISWTMAHDYNKLTDLRLVYKTRKPPTILYKGVVNNFSK